MRVCVNSVPIWDGEKKNKRIGRGLMTEISDAVPGVRQPQWHLGATPHLLLQSPVICLLFSLLETYTFLMQRCS